MFQKYPQLKFFVSSASGLFHEQLPFCLALRSCLHSDSPLKVYAANKIFKTSPRKKHSFKNLYPWKTLTDFSDYLKSSIVYNEDGLVALNKPYGVGIYKRKETEGTEIHNTVNFASQEDFPFSLEDCLQHLRNHLNVQNLDIMKSAERFTSGIVILASTEAAKKRFKKSQNIAKHKGIPQYIYWALINGSPLFPAMKQTVGIKLLDLHYKNEKQPIIVKEFSKKEVKEKKVKTVNVEHRTIATNRETSTSILEIATSSAKWHFLRVYASSQASGILGDMLYAPRMKKLLGKPININPEHIVAYDVQPLPEALCQRLDLPRTVDGHLLVPNMLHLRTVVLPMYLKGRDLIINASAPPHFTWTCSRLDFTLPD